MPANPYTVPAGSAHQQALWVQAYYRNLALQNQYDQQPDWTDALAHGLNTGIGAGVGQYLGTVDQNAKFQQQQNMQSEQETARLYGQDRLFDQQTELQAQHAADAAEAAQLAAIRDQLGKQQTQGNLGTAYQQFYGGMSPIEVAQPDVMQPPADYNDVSQPYPQPPKSVTPPAADVLQGMDPSLVGLLPSDVLKDAMKAPKPNLGLTDDERGTIDLSLKMGDPATRQALVDRTSMRGRTVSPVVDPVKPIPMPYTDSYNEFIGALGYTREAYEALPTERKDAIRKEAKAESEAREIRIQRAQAESNAAILDTRQRAKESDEATRDFMTIRTMLPQIQTKAAQLLQPGIAGKATGLAKEKMQAYFGTYPELQELVSMGEAIKGAVSRRVLLESGMLSTFDVTRTDALIPKGSDNLESALAKTRVLQTFMDASTQAWEAYRSSGLAGAGRPATKTVNDFLPPGFWEQARHTGPVVPGGPWKKVGG